jgi:hypothetical protein
MGGPEILLRGATTYTAKVTDTAHGTIRSVEHTIQHLEEVAETLARNLADTRKRLADTQAQVNAPFEYGERLAELVQRQQQIEDELDLTKNQASAQLGTESAKETLTAEPDADSLKEDYECERGDAARYVRSENPFRHTQNPPAPVPPGINRTLP